MSKLLRIVLVVVSVAVIALLAGGTVVWAALVRGDNPAGVFNGADPALSPWRRKPNSGTVKPPPAISLLVRQSGTFSLGGFCIFKVDSLSPDILFTVERVDVSVLDQPLPVPDGIYLSPVCSVQYHDRIGNHLPGLQPGDGNVQICFAAIPDRFGDIYVDSQFTTPVWTDLATIVDNIEACAPANESGFYVRRGN